MTKYIFISGAVILMTNVANAQYLKTSYFDNSMDTNNCFVTECSSSTHAYVDMTFGQNCSTTAYYCAYVGGTLNHIKACVGCNAGYVSQWATGSAWTACSPVDCSALANSNECDSPMGGQQFKYTTCVCDTTKCADVGPWSNYGTGYQRRSKYTCQSGTCKASSTYEYRCAIGYYGSSTNGTSGCTRCPSSGGIYGTTAAAGSATVASCYLPSGASMSDTTGAYTCTVNAYYK